MLQITTTNLSFGTNLRLDCISQVTTKLGDHEKYEGFEGEIFDMNHLVCKSYTRIWKKSILKMKHSKIWLV